jgi:hypothetical protein
MSKPSTLPRWADSEPETTRTEPSEDHKNDGFWVDERLAAQYLNWLHGVNSDWWDYTNDKLLSGYLIPTDTSALRMTCHNTSGLTLSNASGSAKINADSYNLNSDRTVVIPVLPTSAIPTQYGGSAWVYTSTGHLISGEDNARLRFHAMVPQGFSCHKVHIDWQPVATTPSVAMAMFASRIDATVGSTPTTNSMFAPVPANAGIIRIWQYGTCSAYNTAFGYSDTTESHVVVNVDSSSESIGDIVYGVYLEGAVSGPSMFALSRNAT